MFSDRPRARSWWHIPLVLLVAAPLAIGVLLADINGSATALAEIFSRPALTSTVTPTATYTYTPTDTPPPATEPELAILQYVVDHNPSWTCMGPYGTQGHRYISDCNPFGLFSHPTSGYVDNYGSSGAAQSAWQSRRSNAQSVYPIFMDTNIGGFPAYEAGNNSFPYAHYEKYFWASIRVMGATSSDDTSFRGAPPVASAIYQAAAALDYLGSPPPTSTWTPTYTSTPTQTPMPACGLAWRIVTSPNAGVDGSYLKDITAISPTDVWAVGRYYDPTVSSYRTLTMHWDGSQWSIVPSQNPGDSNELNSVYGASSNDVWAVGYYYDLSTGYYYTLAMHWNGSQWNIVSSPNPGADDNELASVYGTSSNDVWAVGYYYDSSIGYNSTLTIHWNGAQWSIVSSPNPGADDNRLASVHGTSSNDVWAVGYYYYASSNYRTLTMRWDGSQWSIVPSPNPGIHENYLYAVHGTASNDAWAVGFYYESVAPYNRTLTMHWNGAQWSIVPSQNAGADYSELTSVYGSSSDDAWAIGHYYDPSIGYVGTLTMRWDGSQWSIVPSPNVGSDENYLYAVHGTSAEDVWAVGHYSGNTLGYDATLVGHYSNACSTPTHTTTPITSPTPTWTNTYTPSPVPTTPITTPTNTYTPWPVPTCGPSNNNYVINQSTGATLVPGVQKMTGQQDDDTITNIPLPFYVYLYGQGWNLARADSNGNLQFGSDLASNNANQCLPVYNYMFTLMPYWDNLDLRSSVDPNLGIFTSLSGIGPNRIFNIEWRACLWNAGACGGYVNFEVRLYENQNKFDFVYGDVASGGAGATVGAQSIRGAGHTQYSCNTTSLQPGLKLTFTQENCSNYEPRLIGHVMWQGRPAQPDALQQLPITLTIKSGNTELDYQAQATDASGFFTSSVGSLPIGVYNWRVKGPKYLANAGSVPLNRSMYASLEMGLMKVGDADDDNLVNVNDFNILKNTFGKAVGDPGYDDRADFTGDQTVNTGDFNLLRNNYGQGGAPPINPR